MKFYFVYEGGWSFGGEKRGKSFIFGPLEMDVEMCSEMRQCGGQREVNSGM